MSKNTLNIFNVSIYNQLIHDYALSLNGLIKYNTIFEKMNGYYTNDEIHYIVEVYMNQMIDLINSKTFALFVPEKVKKAFNLPVVRCSSPSGITVSRVAMCGGSGSSLIPNAISSGAQAFICGDVSYHHFFTPNGFMIMDIGHFEGEVEICDVLFSLLRKNFPTFAVRTSEKLRSSNPVFYY